MGKKSDQEVLERHNYELSFLAKDEKTAEDVSKLLRRHKAEIDSEQPSKKIDLAYKIKHESQAFLGCFHFRSDAADAKLLEHDIRVNPAILRFLVVRFPQKKYILSGSKESGQKFRPTVAQRESSVAGKRSLRPISNEALERKIEEILQ